jgi:myo-inositol-1(or 4)-monophosphatase
MSTFTQANYLTWRQRSQSLLTRIQQTARQAALEAGALLRQNFTQPHQITLKGRHDPVTESDFQSQNLIIHLLSQAFPAYRFLAEEAGAPTSAQDASEGCWIIDPLDGTVNFAHGFPMFAVSIAFQWQGVVAYGVVYDPMRDELFEAVQGQGARLNDQPLQVSRLQELDRALLATGFPYNVNERLEASIQRFKRLVALAQGVRRPGSAAIDLCYVAAGRFDGFWEEGLKPWDTAAAVLIVQEAGGQVSTFEGSPFALTSDNVVASNGLLHAQILAALEL